MNFTRTIVALSLVLAGAISGCKQKEGEICQIDNDCESGLVCNAATGRCQTPGSGGVDAAPQNDAGVADAAVDAPPQDAGADAS